MSGFACQECGHKFKTIAAAEKAAFGPNGCPKCGGADIDEAVSVRVNERRIADRIDGYDRDDLGLSPDR